MWDHDPGKQAWWNWGAYLGSRVWGSHSCYGHWRNFIAGCTRRCQWGLVEDCCSFLVGRAREIVILVELAPLMFFDRPWPRLHFLIYMFYLESHHINLCHFSIVSVTEWNPACYFATDMDYRSLMRSFSKLCENLYPYFSLTLPSEICCHRHWGPSLGIYRVGESPNRCCFFYLWNHSLPAGNCLQNFCPRYLNLVCLCKCEHYRSCFSGEAPDAWFLFFFDYLFWWFQCHLSFFSY